MGLTFPSESTEPRDFFKGTQMALNADTPWDLMSDGRLEGMARGGRNVSGPEEEPRSQREGGSLFHGHPLLHLMARQELDCSVHIAEALVDLRARGQNIRRRPTLGFAEEK